VDPFIAATAGAWSVDSGSLDIGEFSLAAGQKVDFENGGNSDALLTVGAMEITDVEGRPMTSLSSRARSTPIFRVI
jgi:hypothetical protein